MQKPKWYYLIMMITILSCRQQDRATSEDGYITTQSGLKYKIIQPGKGEVAKVGDEILLFETTSYRDGTVLYSNENTTSPVKVLIGGNQATQGVDEGLRGMKVGEIREIVALRHLVKRASYPPNVSPDSTLVIKLILHDIL